MFKKVALIVVLSLFCILSTVSAREASQSSGLKTSDAAVLESAGYLTGVLILADGTNEAIVVIYDNASAASGNIIFKGIVAAGKKFGGGLFSSQIRFKNGCYVDVSGTNAAYIVYYDF